MARGGINKALVKLALERLVAKGEHPSIDAIRVELGNTGSKTTISRYLAELNEESASRLGDKISLSDTLNELVGNLAAQLHREAEQIIEQAKEASLNTVETLQAKITASDQAQLEVKHQCTLLESQLALSEQSRLTTTQELHECLLKIERLTQELRDKDVQISAKDAHINSLEEKHQHARLALEHYRESVKEQREQDQRRHETQVQQLQAEVRQLNQTISIKQTDITQLNKDNSQFTAEVRELRKQLSSNIHKLEQLDMQLKSSEERLAVAIHKGAKLDVLIAENQRITIELLEFKQAIKLIEIQLASTTTELNVKNQLLESLGSQFAQAVRNT